MYSHRFICFHQNRNCIRQHKTVAKVKRIVGGSTVIWKQYYDYIFFPPIFLLSTGGRAITARERRGLDRWTRPRLWRAVRLSGTLPRSPSAQCGFGRPLRRVYCEYRCVAFWRYRFVPRYAILRVDSAVSDGGDISLWRHIINLCNIVCKKQHLRCVHS